MERYIAYCGDKKLDTEAVLERLSADQRVRVVSHEDGLLMMDTDAEVISDLEKAELKEWIVTKQRSAKQPEPVRRSPRRSGKTRRRPKAGGDT